MSNEETEGEWYNRMNGLGPEAASVDMVNHPPHYKALDGVDFECIELARRFTFDVGNAVKYMWRTDAKNGCEDVDKARWYVEDAISTGDVMHVDQRPTFTVTTKRMLRAVAAAQADPDRAAFFTAISQTRLLESLAALQRILLRQP